MAVETSYNASV